MNEIEQICWDNGYDERQWIKKLQMNILNIYCTKWERK